MTPRRLRIAAAAGLAIAAAAAPGAALEGGAAAPPPRTPEEAADRFLEAFRAGGPSAEETGPVVGGTDPWRVADALLRRHADGTLADPPAPRDFLAAARDLAARSAARPGCDRLPAFVEAWSAMDREGLESERRIRDAVRRMPSVAREGGAAKAAALEAELRPDLDRCRHSLAARDLAYEVGAACDAAGDRRGAADAFLEAVRRSRDLGWPAGRTGWGGALSRAAAACRDLGRFRLALSLYEDEIDRARAIGFRPAIHGTEGNMAVVHALLGDFPLAQELFERSWRGFESLAATGGPGVRIGALQMRKNAILNLALIGGSEDGIRDLEEIRAAAAALGPQAALLHRRCDEAAGYVHLRAGRYAEAVGSYERAVAAHREAGDRPAAAVALRGLAEAWMEAGDPDRARALQEEALREFAAMGNAVEPLAVRYALARGRLLSGEYAEAKARFGEVLEGARALGVRTYASFAHLGIASAALELGDAAGALASFAKAREAALANGEAREASRAEAGTARALHALGRSREARALLARTIPAARQVGNLAALAADLGTLARLELDDGRAAAAHAAARESLEFRLRVCVALGEFAGAGERGELHATCDTGLEACRALAAGTPARPGAADDALSLLEAARAAALVEALRNRDSLLRAHAGPEIATQSLAARRRADAARAEIADLAARGAPPAEMERSRAALDAADADLRAVAVRIRRVAGIAAEAADPRSAAPAEIRAALGPDAVLLLYRLGRPVRAGAEARGTAIVVDSGGTRLADLGPAAEIARRAEAWAALAAAEGSREEDLAAALHDLLVRPVQESLRGRTRVLVSPDGPLHLVPFEALLRREASGARRLVEDHEVAYVPSGTVLAALAAQSAGVPAGEGLLVVADPAYPAAGAAAPGRLPRAEALAPLPGTAAEARALLPLFPEGRRTLLAGRDATVAALAAALSSTRGRLAAVHLACHGRTDLRRPLLSGVALAGGEVFALHDLHRVRVPADLAVLSACESGQGALVDGEGLVGLVRGFFLAGCPRVVVSGWKVRDADAAAFMADFYRAMRRDGLRPAAALRAVKRARIAAGGDAAHPSRWAAFLLWGLPE